MDNELSEALKTASNRLNYYHTEIGKLLKGIESGLNQIKKSSDHHKDYKGEKGPNWGHVGTMSEYHKTLSDLHDRIHQQGEYMTPSVMKEESEQNTAAQVASNKHLKAAAQALALAKGVGKNHPDYNTYMAMYASHRKKMMGEEIEQIYEASRSAVHAAWNGEEDKFHKLMGITDSTAKNHPDYVRSKKKYKELRAMGDGASIADAMKKLNEEVEAVDEGVGVRNQVRKAILAGAKTSKGDIEHGINKDIITKLKGKEAGKTYDTARKMVAKEEVEVIDEAIRTIGTHKSEDGNHIAKVRRDVENNEYRVELHSNGKHQRDADYFTDDEDDAHSTAEHMVAHAQKNSKKMTSEAIITLVKNIKNKKAGISDEAMQKKKQ